jgi:predicted carbohydrate-binding protein with CBM5 and CBM33 domain
MRGGALTLLLAAVLVAGVHGHGWLSFPESRNSRLNTASTTPVQLQNNRMNGNGRAKFVPGQIIAQPGETLGLA